MHVRVCVSLCVCEDPSNLNQGPRAQSFVAKKMTALVSFRQDLWARCLSAALRAFAALSCLV